MKKGLNEMGRTNGNAGTLNGLCRMVRLAGHFIGPVGSWRRPKPWTAAWTVVYNGARTMADATHFLCLNGFMVSSDHSLSNRLMRLARITAFGLGVSLVGMSGATTATAQIIYDQYGAPPLPPGATLVPPGQVVVPSQGVMPSQVVPSTEVVTAPEVAPGESFPTKNGNTFVQPPSELAWLVEDGGVPQSMEQLRLLQLQQQRVAAAAETCTVSIQIGPAQGCGVIITPSGYVLTAAHVAMRPGKTAKLTLNDGRTVFATTLGMNRNVDAGLLKIDSGQTTRDAVGREMGWPHASLGTSELLRSGMWCIATGHPGGYDSDRGMVTRVGRILAVHPDRLVTDCALIGGDSGGPLFDLSGRLIAVHSRIGNDVADNLHVPIDNYGYSANWRRMKDSEAWGYLDGFRPVLGVRGNSDGGIANVVKIGPGSPADEAGMEEGDQVVSFGDVQITDFESLKAAVADTMPGERVKVWLRRDGRPVRVTVEIGRAD